MINIIDITWANLLIIALGGVLSLTIVIGTEILNRKDIIRGEIARKSSHFGLGLLLFSWLSIWGHEMYLTMLLLALTATLILWPLKLFRAMRDVKRETIGHLLYPIGLMIVALVYDSVAANQVALLHLFVVDTAAALIGKRFDSPVLMKFAGSQKTVVGSLAFAACSLVVFSVFIAQDSNLDGFEYLLFAASAAMVMTSSEMFGFYGLDNLYLPMLSAVIFSLIV